MGNFNYLDFIVDFWLNKKFIIFPEFAKFKKQTYLAAKLYMNDIVENYLVYVLFTDSSK